MSTTSERSMKEILGEYVALRKKNDNRICGFITNDSQPAECEERKIEAIEASLRKERELALTVIRIIDTVADPGLRQILELRYMKGLGMREITKELYGNRKNFPQKEGAYLQKARHRLGHALQAAENAAGQKEKAGPDTGQPVLRHATTQIVAEKEGKING